MPASEVRPGRAIFFWTATLAASAGATVLDAFLLQRRLNYFTGGFLATDHITSPQEGLAFLAASLATDLALLGVIVAVVLWAAARVGLGGLPAAVAAALAAGASVVVADVVAYGLLDYLGEGVDLALLFRLAGGNPAEFLAVSSSHLVWIGTAVLTGLLAVVGALIWLARRARRVGPRRLERHALRAALTGPLLLLLLVAAATTVVRAGSDVLDNGLRRKPTGRLLGIVIGMASDVDRDGFGMLGRLRDPAPFDASIHPYALDVPANGIDENALAGDLPAGDPYREPDGASPQWRSRRDVVFVVLESVRADVLDEEVNGRPVTPVMRDLAARGVRSRIAYSHNGYTVQSRYHLFSGSLAGVRGSATLLDDFRANGYETAYVSGQDESFGGSAWDVGFERADLAFDGRSAPDERYSTFATPGSLSLPFTVVADRVGTFLRERQPDRPLFLVVNFHDTHFPYSHAGIAPLVSDTTLPQAEIGPSRASDLRAIYMNTVANVDRAIGEVLAAVRATTGREPAVIVTADHGESLYDDGSLGHGFILNDVQTMVPFVVANLPAVLTEPMGQSDLRDMLWAALDADDGQAPPRIVRPEGRLVFQYLGTVDAPVQIAHTGIGSRIVYDFRSRRVSVEGGAWQSPDDLDPREAGRFTTLVHAWERMRLAQAAAPAER